MECKISFKLQRFLDANFTSMVAVCTHSAIEGYAKRWPEVIDALFVVGCLS